jgi:hypothetical protein
MPVFIEEMTSEVAVAEGELPLSPAQIEKLVQLVLKRLADKQQDDRRMREATQLRRQAAEPFEPGV